MGKHIRVFCLLSSLPDPTLKDGFIDYFLGGEGQGSGSVG